MTELKNKPQEIEEREIVITRVVNAPRERVWEVFADPKQVVQWWGPKGFSDTIIKHEFRVGGRWEHTMHGPDGMDYPNKSVFKEIVKPERVVFAHGGSGKDMPVAGFEASWTFEAQGQETRVTMRSVFPTKEARDTVVNAYNAIQGGNETLDRLAEYLRRS